MAWSNRISFEGEPGSRFLATRVATHLFATTITARSVWFQQKRGSSDLCSTTIYDGDELSLAKKAFAFRFRSETSKFLGPEFPAPAAMNHSDVDNVNEAITDSASRAGVNLYERHRIDPGATHEHYPARLAKVRDELLIPTEMNWSGA